MFEGNHHPRKAVGHENIFFDTLVHDTGSLKLLVENQGAPQIILGLDDPYPLGEMESESQSSYPGKILDLAVDEEIISTEESEAMWNENIVRWLFGRDKEAEQKFKKRVGYVEPVA